MYERDGDAVHNSVVLLSAMGKIEGRYRKVLEWALDHRIVSCIIGGAIFFLTLGLASFIPTGFQPESNNNYYFKFYDHTNTKRC